ncbi:MAG: hypothetical protein HY465_05200 [Deltaproteobacteria bacterium]|nr:hypothetical protein [Deltaproteobacteria bacterium]
MSVEKINTNILSLPPAWMSRVQERGGSIANADAVKKLLGEPIPQAVDPKTLTPHIAAMFARGGILDRLRKKLALLSKKKGGRLIPSKGVIASVDEDDNVYVGVDFLEQFGDDEALLAGILAHEWGHMVSDLPKGMDWSHLTWDEIHALRRDEEAYADGFAGRALFFLNYTPESMVDFLKTIDRRRKDKKLPTLKYHNTATRVEILRQSFEASRRTMQAARRIFGGRKTGPKIGRVIGAG